MKEQRKPLNYYLELEYPYTVVPDDGAFFIRFPDLTGCMTQVEDPTEIARMAEEIRMLWINGEYEDGATIPEPSGSVSRYSGKFQVRLPKSLHRDLAEQAKHEGMSLNAYVNYLLAERNMASRTLDRLYSLPTKPVVPIVQRSHRLSEQTMPSTSTAVGPRPEPPPRLQKHHLKLVEPHKDTA